MARTTAWVKQNFGDFVSRDDPEEHGRVIVPADWVVHNIARIEPPFPMETQAGDRVREIPCHALVADSLTEVLQEVAERGLTHTIETYDGCWVPRHKGWNPRRTLSRHTWGIAIDLNAALCPYDSDAQQDARLVGLFEKHGWEWGGRWRTPDPMHFEVVNERAMHPRWTEAERFGLMVLVNDEVVSRQGSIRGGTAEGPLRSVVEALGGSISYHPEQGENGKVYIYTRRGRR